MKQIIQGKSYGNIGSAPLVTPLRGYQWAQLVTHSQPWSVAGTFKNLYVEILAPVENKDALYWDDTTFTLVIDGIDTALTVVVPGMGPISENGFQASAQNITNIVSITPGQSVALKRQSGTWHGNTNAAYVNCDWSLTFESTNIKESGYGGGSASQKVNTLSSVFWCPPLNCQMTSWVGVAAPDTIDSVLAHSIVPLNCSLYRVDFHLASAPGSNSFKIFAYKNGVKQDGSGGTVDTGMVITGSATKYSFLFDLPLVPLNWLSLHLDQTFTTGTYNDYITVGCALRATTDGESAYCFSNGIPTIDGTTDWCGKEGSGWAWTTQNSPTPSPSWRPVRWPSTELLISSPGAIDPFTLSGLCVNLNHFPGVAKSYTFTARKTFTDSASTVEMTGNADPDSRLKTDPLNGSVSFDGVDDRLDIQSIADGTPTAASVGWTWLMVVTEPVITGAIYKIVPNKRNDTLFDIGDVKIPDPFFKTGLIGG